MDTLGTARRNDGALGTLGVEYGTWCERKTTQNTARHSRYVQRSATCTHNGSAVSGNSGVSYIRGGLQIDQGTRSPSGGRTACYDQVGRHAISTGGISGARVTIFGNQVFAQTDAHPLPWIVLCAIRNNRHHGKSFETEAACAPFTPGDVHSDLTVLCRPLCYPLWIRSFQSLLRR